MKFTRDVADSIILASFNLLLLASGFLLLTTSYAILSVAVFWCALPFGLLFTVGFLIQDFRRGLRKQAMIAIWMFLPVLAFEVWLLGFHSLDF